MSADTARSHLRRFYCHKCNEEVQPNMPEVVCPKCHFGFVEERDWMEEDMNDEPADDTWMNDDDDDDDDDDVSTEILQMLGASFAYGNRDSADHNYSVNGASDASSPNDQSASRSERRLRTRRFFARSSPLHTASAGGSSRDVQATEDSRSAGSATSAATRSLRRRSARNADASYSSLTNVNGERSNDGANSSNDRFGAIRRVMQIQIIQQGEERPQRTRGFRGFIRGIVNGLMGSRHGTAPETFTAVFPVQDGDYSYQFGGLDNIITSFLSQLDGAGGPPPAPNDEIDNIPTIKISTIETDKKLQCNVCLDEYELDENVRKLRCQHLYHSDCIVPWLKLHNTCPVCRKNLAGETVATCEMPSMIGLGGGPTRLTRRTSRTGSSSGSGHSSRRP